MARCVVDGRGFALTRRGHGPPLLLLNGFAAGRQDWDPTFLDAVGHRHELVMVDHRGIGGSWHDGARFTIADLTADIAELIGAMGLERPAALGWSMGGFVALSLALSRPGLVDKLVLLSASAGGSSTTFGRPQVQAQLPDFSGSPREQATRLISLLFEPERARQIDAQFGEIVATSRATLPMQVVAQQWDAAQEWARHGVLDRLSGLDCPTLIATGLDDIVIPPENALALAQAIPGSWLARFPRCGHGFIADHPEELAGLITLFLACA